MKTATTAPPPAQPYGGEREGGGGALPVLNLNYHLKDIANDILLKTSETKKIFNIFCVAI
jgi:hypothetical protein